MSIPTSIVVVHERTSIAGLSCPVSPRTQVNILEEDLVLFRLGENLVRLSGVDLRGVLCSNESHWRYRAVTPKHANVLAR